MPRDNAIRVLQGAHQLAPHLGKRMIAARMLDRSVFLGNCRRTTSNLKVNNLVATMRWWLQDFLAESWGKHMRDKWMPRPVIIGIRVAPEPYQDTRCAVLGVVKCRRIGRNS